MPSRPVDLDRLALHLRNRLVHDELSLRGAAGKIGCSPATLSRLLKGGKSPNMPDAEILFRVVSWLGRSWSDFAPATPPPPSNISDVEIYLRALPDLRPRDKEALVGIVKAAYQQFQSHDKDKR